MGFEKIYFGIAHHYCWGNPPQTTVPPAAPTPISSCVIDYLLQRAASRCLNCRVVNPSLILCTNFITSTPVSFSMVHCDL